MHPISFVRLYVVEFCWAFTFNPLLPLPGTHRVSEEESPGYSSVSRWRPWGWRWTGRKWSLGASQSVSPGRVGSEEREWGVSSRKERWKGIVATFHVTCVVVRKWSFSNTVIRWSLLLLLSFVFVEQQRLVKMINWFLAYLSFSVYARQALIYAGFTRLCRRNRSEPLACWCPSDPSRGQRSLPGTWRTARRRRRRRRGRKTRKTRKTRRRRKA